MRRNNLLRALTCSFVFTMLFSFEAQAKNFDNLFQLPDFSNKVVWVIRVGAGFNGVVGSNKETTKLQWNDGDWNGDFKKSIGYDISLGFNKSFAKRPLYWGMELGMTTRGYKTSASWEKGGTSAISGGSDYHGKFQDATMLCHTVRLSPFIVGYRYIFLEKMAADIHLGAYASYDFAGKYTDDYTDHIVSTSHYGDRNDKTVTSTEIKIKDYNGLRRYDVGINLGVGYWFGRFNIDFTWQRGFIAIYGNGSEQIKIDNSMHTRGDLFTNNFQLKLGYAF